MIPIIFVILSQGIGSYYNNYIELSVVSALKFNSNFNASKGELELIYQHSPDEHIKKYSTIYTEENLNKLFVQHAPKAVICQNMGKNDIYEYVWQCQDMYKNEYIRWDYDEVKCLHHPGNMYKIRTGSCQLTRYLMMKSKGRNFVHSLNRSDSVLELAMWIFCFIFSVFAFSLYY